MTCPICARPTEARYRPFCSRRCADIDLGKWLTGAYAIPVTPEEAPDDTFGDGPDALGDNDGQAGRKPH